jgi:hypothetical protein
VVAFSAATDTWSTWPSRFHAFNEPIVTGVNLAILLSLLFLLELSAQVIALLRPSYEVLYLQPDRALGWKQVPNLRWKWTGFHWYACRL